MICQLFQNPIKNFVVFCFFVFILLSQRELVLASSLQSVDRPFTIALLPDTQKYKNFSGIARAHIFDSQTQWIADHIIDENIVLTLHLGDIVDISVNSLWDAALSSLDYLNGLVPLVLTAGNHDISELVDPGSATYTESYQLFNKRVPASRFNKLPWFGGIYEKGKIENAYYFFNFGRVEYIVLALEYGPRDKVLDWANKIVEKYSEKTAIIVTHAYMAKGPKRLKAGDKYSPKLKEVPYHSKEYEYLSKEIWANDGDVIWERLAKKHKNIMFVFSGHSKGPGKLISKGVNGNPVFQVGANYQWEENGGNGYLRLMKFYPKTKKVTVKTYSPLLDHFRTDWENQFLIDLNTGEFLKLELPSSP